MKVWLLAGPDSKTLLSRDTLPMSESRAAPGNQEARLVVVSRPAAADVNPPLDSQPEDVMKSSLHYARMRKDATRI
jgi:hypothetical protein